MWGHDKYLDVQFQISGSLSGDADHRSDMEQFMKWENGWIGLDDPKSKLKSAAGLPKHGGHVVQNKHCSTVKFLGAARACSSSLQKQLSSKKTSQLITNYFGSTGTVSNNNDGARTVGNNNEGTVSNMPSKNIIS